MLSIKSLLKKFLIALLVIHFYCNLVGMNSQEMCDQRIQKAFNQTYQIDQSHPIVEGMKLFVGLGCTIGGILGGAHIVRKSLEGIHAIPEALTAKAVQHSASVFKNHLLNLDSKTQTILCGTAACTVIGLSLMAWIKPGQFRKNQQERQFTHCKNAAFNSILNNPDSEAFKQSITIDADDYLSVIDDFIKGNSINNFKKTEENPILTIDKNIKNLVTNINNQNNTCLFNYFLTKKNKIDYTPTADELEKVSIYNFYEVKKNPIEINPYLYIYFLTHKHNKKNNNNSKKNITINMKHDKYDYFAVSFNDKNKLMNNIFQKSFRINSIQDYHYLFINNYNETLKKEYNIFCFGCFDENSGSFKYFASIPFKSNEADKKDYTKTVKNLKMATEACVNNKCQLIAYLSNRVLAHNSHDESSCAFFIERNNIQEIAQGGIQKTQKPPIDDNHIIQHALQQLVDEQKSDNEYNPCVIIKYNEQEYIVIKNNEQEYIVIKNAENLYTTNFYPPKNNNYHTCLVNKDNQNGDYLRKMIVDIIEKNYTNKKV
ncbi:hypothetical protein KC460_04810 [Candidatus Dependentiae bacterium]|nr:hypothetical protein [Candidatus Dependentiae bacterium]